MDFSEVDHALEELESRIERLKALYEQYFMGIEKLEPLVPRKDVDRRIMILRREQVRNTAQRFKFQTLVQRYNSFQQYWARVAREIDNGTYHRDVARAAARFGAKETLTIFGRKQAEKYQRLVANQEARRARRTTTHTIDEEMLADDELLFVDDEQEAEDIADADDESRPTPVIAKPTQGSAPPLAIPPLPPPPRASSPGMPSVPPPLPPVVRGSGQMPAPIVNVKEDVPEELDLADDDILEYIPDKPGGARRKIRPDTMFPIMMRRPSETLPKAEPSSQEPAPAHRSQTMPLDPEAKKRRVAALAAQVKHRGSQTTMPQAGSTRPLDLELDLGGGARAREEQGAKAERALDLDFDRGSQPKEKPPAKAERPLDLALDQGSRVREEQAAKVERPAPQVAPVRAEAEGLAGRTEPREERIEALRAAVAAEAREQAAAQAGRDPEATEERRAAGARAAAAARERAASARDATGEAAGLSDKRIRQIYGEYVDAKRSVKESTAGVTFDTLAKQLRQQAEKLEASHPGRKVDYSVVMKNGRPTLKPVLR
ncbi:MAG: hypothetical protein IPM54_32475 [Polyangiaceae bacterium]|nr:hypothetical protein [Polyangiaceae bacterium]